MSKLFSSWTVKNLTLRNRLVRSATWEGLADDNGVVTDRLVEVYDVLARHGVGLIITGFAYVRPDGRAVPGQMGIHDDGLVAGLKRLCDASHAHGCPIFCQIVHAGLNTKPDRIGGELPLAMSVGEFPGYGRADRELAAEEIWELVNGFASAEGRSWRTNPWVARWTTRRPGAMERRRASEAAGPASTSTRSSAHRVHLLGGRRKRTKAHSSGRGAVNSAAAMSRGIQRLQPALHRRGIAVRRSCDVPCTLVVHGTERQEAATHLRRHAPGNDVLCTRQVGED
ncbi:hypothetical protein ACFL59_15685, partial [Planctomycetota bacterium]